MKWEPFTTLQEIFTVLPADLGFNIELKYPSPAEKTAHGLTVLSPEAYVEEVMKVVKKSAEGRRVVFSSFDADVLIAAKHVVFLVFFIIDHFFFSHRPMNPSTFSQ